MTVLRPAGRASAPNEVPIVAAMLPVYQAQRPRLRPVRPVVRQQPPREQGPVLLQPADERPGQLVAVPATGRLMLTDPQRAVPLADDGPAQPAALAQKKAVDGDVGRGRGAGYHPRLDRAGARIENQGALTVEQLEIALIGQRQFTRPRCRDR